ncbi:MAG: ChbG/HpnK family deacetylase [Chthoniobacterales bacterium]
MSGVRAPANATRFLIVNADDFGLSEGVNRGIAQAHEDGIVTSASLMVRPPAAQTAASYARAHPSLSVGLHFDAAEWRYESGEWIPAYTVINLDHATEVRHELTRQLAEFERLIGTTPTHLDSHQHVHQREPALSILREVARQLSIPLRGYADSTRYCGDFYGQTREGEAYVEGISRAALSRLIIDLPLGWTELGCHPGRAEKLASVYGAEREVELRTLCDPRIREVIAREAVELCSFVDYARQRAAAAPQN